MPLNSEPPVLPSQHYISHLSLHRWNLVSLEAQEVILEIMNNQYKKNICIGTSSQINNNSSNFRKSFYPFKYLCAVYVAISDIRRYTSVSAKITVVKGPRRVVKITKEVSSPISVCTSSLRGGEWLLASSSWRFASLMLLTNGFHFLQQLFFLLQL